MHKDYLAEYVEGRWQSPTTREIGDLFNSITTAELLSPFPGYWKNIVMLDISANDGTVATELAKHMWLALEATSVTSPSSVTSPLISIFWNDIAYNPSALFKNQITRRAQRRREKANNLLYPLIEIKPLIAKDARILKSDNLHGNKANIIIDRLGAFWHLLEKSNSIEEVTNLLSTLSFLLVDGGGIVLDNYRKFKSRRRGIPSLSSGNYLEQRLQQGDKDLQLYLMDNGFEPISVAPSNIAYKDREKNIKLLSDDTNRILVLRKLRKL